MERNKLKPSNKEFQFKGTDLGNSVVEWTRNHQLYRLLLACLQSPILQHNYTCILYLLVQLG